MATPRKPKDQHKKRGRPHKFRPETMLPVAKALAEFGATDEEVAAFYKINIGTLMRWKNEFPEFRDALIVGKEAADNRVQNSLFHRAIGYSVKTKKMVQVKGKMVEIEQVEHFPPDTTACIFWLKNRRRDLWRDKYDVEHDVAGEFAERLRKANARAPETLELVSERIKQE